MLNCKQVTELVTDYLEGKLSFRQRLAFQMHVGMCTNCREYLRQMKTTIRVLGKVPEEPMPLDVRDELMARFRKVHPRPAVRTVVPASVRLLAVLEKRVGGARGWLLSGLMLLGALVAAFLVGLQPGPLGDGSPCLGMELGAGFVPIAALGWLASVNRSRLSVGTILTVGLASGLVAFALLEVTCPMRHAAQHVLLFHLGGLVCAGLASLAASRLPVFRSM